MPMARRLGDPIARRVAIGKLPIDLAARPEAFIEHGDLDAGARQSNRGRHPAWAGADNADFCIHHAGAAHGLPPGSTTSPSATGTMHARTTAPSMRTRHS